jgi:hypothetical protein
MSEPLKATIKVTDLKEGDRVHLMPVLNVEQRDGAVHVTLDGLSRPEVYHPGDYVTVTR